MTLSLLWEITLGFLLVVLTVTWLIFRKRGFA